MFERWKKKEKKKETRRYFKVRTWRQMDVKQNEEIVTSVANK